MKDYIAVFTGSERVDEDAWIPCSSSEVLRAATDSEAVVKAKAMLNHGIRKEIKSLRIVGPEISLEESGTTTTLAIGEKGIAQVGETPECEDGGVLRL